MPSFTTSDGVRLDYTESGSSTGRAVVLIAGFKAPATSWRGQVKVLERAGYRVIALDRRGHGTSEKGPAASNLMARHGTDLGEFLAELDLHDAVLVGGSMGGNVIWAAIGQGGLVSAAGTDRVSGIVIVDQTPQMLNTDDWAFGFYDYDETNRDTLFKTGIPDPGRFPAKSKSLIRIVRVLSALATGHGGTSMITASELALLNDHAKADWRPVIAKSPIPVLFVAGAESEFWPSGHAPAAAALAPAGRSLVIPKDGHAANIEQPKAFNEALLGFISDIR